MAGRELASERFGEEPSSGFRQLRFDVIRPATEATDAEVKRAGRVLTPGSLACALARWAIQSPQDVVVDLGVGEGAFVLAGFQRLRELGADGASAAAQIYGAEYDPEVFGRAQAAARLKLGQPLPNVVCADFYDTLLPRADAVVGNPPYIRRHYQADLPRVRAASGTHHANGLTDSYCYFLMRACEALKTGGRIAVIVSASWLDMKYGQELKKLLLEDFDLSLLLAFEGRVFSRALVKPIVLLAEKSRRRGHVSFARLGHATPMDSLDQQMRDLVHGRPIPDANVARVPQAELSPALPWSLYLKTPEVFDALMEKAHLTPLREVAESRIGLQTFARRFHIMTRAEAQGLGVEPEYLLPLVSSPRDARSPAITDSGQTRHLVLACDRPLDTLAGTGVGRYISLAMRTPVTVRGKDEIVRGFDQLPRLMRARRQPWYNLRTAIEKRGSYPILLPRRFFEAYLVVHNRTGVVANEDFIELSPRAGERAVEPLLVFLNSSVGEFLMRLHAFQYGGGVFNLNPGAVKDIPVMDPSRLSEAERTELVHTWNGFVAAEGKPEARREIDRCTARVLGIPAGVYARVVDALALLTRLARDSAKLYQENGDDDVAL